MCFAKRMALDGMGGTSGGAGRRYAEWGALPSGAGGQNAMCDEKIVTMKF
ncbi:hypothetical protein [uncultured Campylobacter sp.]|nr:hypothetical protein [uncultured Campylobacter sp.]